MLFSYHELLDSSEMGQQNSASAAVSFIGLLPGTKGLRTAPRTHIYKHEILRPFTRVAGFA